MNVPPTLMPTIVALSELVNGEALDTVSPLAVPVLLEIGRESVYGEAAEQILAETEDELLRTAMS